MNALKRKITAVVVLCLFASGLTLAQDDSEQKARDALQKEVDVVRKEAEIAARQAQKQAEIARKQTEAKALSITPPASLNIKPPEPPMTGWSSGFGSRWPFRSSRGGSVLVIPSAEIETKDLLAINEDLNVMSRIFVTNLQKARVAPEGVGILLDVPIYGNLFSGRGNDSIQSMYLQGYGAIFLMKVDFPLSPGPKEVQKDETEKEQEGDKVWEETRRGLYEPETFTKRKKDNSAPKYDAKKVENLKTTVVSSLKHASNIRNLKQNESVIITITGSSGSSGNIFATPMESGQVAIYDKDRRITRIVADPEPGDLGLTAPVVLIIRAQKADIDSFANGDIDLEQFRQRVQLISYPHLDAGFLREDMEDYYTGRGLGRRR